MNLALCHPSVVLTVFYFISTSGGPSDYRSKPESYIKNDMINDKDDDDKNDDDDNNDIKRRRNSRI